MRDVCTCLASRGSKALGHKVERSVKAYIPEDEVEACRGWCMDYIVEEVMAKVVGLHMNIEGIRVETVLKTECVEGQQGVAHPEGFWGLAGQ